MDLSYVPFMDCAGARVLAEAQVRAARMGGQLALVGLRRRPAQVLRQLGLGSMSNGAAVASGGHDGSPD